MQQPILSTCAVHVLRRSIHIGCMLILLMMSDHALLHYMVLDTVSVSVSVSVECGGPREGDVLLFCTCSVAIMMMMMMMTHVWRHSMCMPSFYRICSA